MLSNRKNWDAKIRGDSIDRVKGADFKQLFLKKMKRSKKGKQYFKTKKNSDFDICKEDKKEQEKSFDNLVSQIQNKLDPNSSKKQFSNHLKSSPKKRRKIQNHLYCTQNTQIGGNKRKNRQMEILKTRVRSKLINQNPLFQTIQSRLQKNTSIDVTRDFKNAEKSKREFGQLGGIFSRQERPRSKQRGMRSSSTLRGGQSGNLKWGLNTSMLARRDPIASQRITSSIKKMGRRKMTIFEDLEEGHSISRFQDSPLISRISNNNIHHNHHRHRNQNNSLLISRSSQKRKISQIQQEDSFIHHIPKATATGGSGSKVNKILFSKNIQSIKSLFTSVNRVSPKKIHFFMSVLSLFLLLLLVLLS